MPAKKPTVKILEWLTETDKKVLEAIYQHRCLNENLLYRFFYKKDEIARSYAAKRIRWMLQQKLLEPVEYGEDFPALFLTTLGIETYRYVYNLPAEVLDFDTGKMKNALRLASELKMKPNNLRHQMAMSEFGLTFEARADKKLAYRYSDEKFIDIYTVVRPDALIELNNVDLFLEMDMATERRTQLMQKWNHYREFLKSKEYRYKGKKMVMLFIVNNVKMVEQRRNTILSTLQIGLLDTLDSCFEIFVDTPENLMDIIFDKYVGGEISQADKIHTWCQKISYIHQFIFSSSSFMKPLVPYTDFFAYIRKLNEQKHILIQNGRPQEFLFDFYINRPVSVLKKIVYYQSMCGTMLSSLHRKIPYLVVVEDEKEFYKELQLMQVLDTDGVYFTTQERLEGTSFPEALFQYDNIGNLFHFTDFSLEAKVFEKKVSI